MSKLLPRSINPCNISTVSVSFTRPSVRLVNSQPKLFNVNYWGGGIIQDLKQVIVQVLGNIWILHSVKDVLKAAKRFVFVNFVTSVETWIQPCIENVRRRNRLSIIPLVCLNWWRAAVEWNILGAFKRLTGHTYLANEQRFIFIRIIFISSCFVFSKTIISIFLLLCNPS